ncbi:MAG: hypothetical protein PHQ34_15635, partial [Methanothrix sp.]|nr:hypothetical protein [Methanothrix sp.]
MSLLGVDFNPFRSEIAVLDANKNIELIDFNLNTDKFIDLGKELDIINNNNNKIYFLDDPDTVAIILNKSIVIVDLLGSKPVKKYFTKLDHFEETNYRPEENSIYNYQYDINSNRFLCEIVNLNNMCSEVISNDLKGAISRKDNLMISFEINQDLMFKVIDLEPNIFLFNWKNVPGIESDSLIRFLMDEYEFNLKEREINKSDDGKIVNVFNYETIFNIQIDKTEEIVEIGWNKKIKVIIDGFKLIIIGEKYNTDKRMRCFEDILYVVENLEEFWEKPIDSDNRKLLNYLGISTGYEKIYRSADGKFLYINRERLAQITIYASEGRSHLVVSN